MPTNHDETLHERYAREHQAELASIASMTPEQISELVTDSHNALAERDAALAELAALKGGREAVIEYVALDDGLGTVIGCHAHGFTPKAGDLLYTAPPAQASAWVAGVEAVAKLIEKKADDYAMEHGHDDMGGLSFGSGHHAQAKADYHGSLIELAEEVRAMLADPTPGASDGKGDE